MLQLCGRAAARHNAPKLPRTIPAAYARCASLPCTQKLPVPTGTGWVAKLWRLAQNVLTRKGEGRHYQLAGQHLKPDASGIPPATLHASAASFLRTSSTAATRHGGTPHSTCFQLYELEVWPFANFFLYTHTKHTKRGLSAQTQ